MPKEVAVHKVLEILKIEVQNYNVPVVDLIEVQTQDPFKILLATILSARTNDRTTAAACKKLFTQVKSIDDLEQISQDKLQELIYPVGFYKNKSKYLKALPSVLRQKFQGKIPETVDELVHLPGVGRKTANLVSAVAFKHQAICVDIHVHRIMNRLGYVKTNTPLETEKELRRKLPAKYWKMVNTLLVAFGQNLCRPLAPHCSQCPVKDYCRRVNVEKQR